MRSCCAKVSCAPYQYVLRAEDAQEHAHDKGVAAVQAAAAP